MDLRNAFYGSRANADTNTCLGLVEELGVARQAEGVEQPRQNEVLLVLVLLGQGKPPHPFACGESVQKKLSSACLELYDTLVLRQFSAWKQSKQSSGSVSCVVVPTWHDNTGPKRNRQNGVAKYARLLPFLVQEIRETVRFSARYSTCLYSSYILTSVAKPMSRRHARGRDS